MINRISSIAYNTFREAVRDRVLYNLILFAFLMVGSALLFGQVSLGIERLWLVNLGLSSIALFGVLIAIFIGIGLVSKEIERKTLYTVLARPVRRWEFLIGKFFGLSMTLTVNAFFMAVGFYVALFYLTRQFTREDAMLLIAIYFIILQFMIITASALLFSSFSSPVLAAVMSFAMFVIGSFSDDLRGFAELAPGAVKVLTIALSYVVPNLNSLNIVSQSAHGVSVPLSLIAWNTLYALFYSAVMLSAAVMVFDRRNFK